MVPWHIEMAFVLTSVDPRREMEKVHLHSAGFSKTLIWCHFVWPQSLSQGLAASSKGNLGFVIA